MPGGAPPPNIPIGILRLPWSFLTFPPPRVGPALSGFSSFFSNWAKLILPGRGPEAGAEEPGRGCQQKMTRSEQ